VDIVADPGVSAKNGNRPGYQELRRRLLDGEAEAVVVYRLDRLTRNLRDLTNLFGEGGELEKKGIAFASACEEFDTSTPAGQAMMGMLGLFAQFERQTIAQRQRTVTHYRQQRGEYRGAVPYGWRVPEGGSHKDWRSWERVADEQRALKRMRRQRRDGWPYQKIADKLNADAVPAPRGGQWSVGNVYRVLNRNKRGRGAR
jgi:DNA invertase Pin-like site-specific DNA recombinase